jgi:hypothetical protein
MHPAAAAICRKLFNTHKLEHALYEMDTTADNSTPSPGFLGNVVMMDQPPSLRVPAYRSMACRTSSSMALL